MSAPNRKAAFEALDRLAAILEEAADFYEKDRPAEGSPRDLMLVAYADELGKRSWKILKAMERLADVMNLPREPEEPS